jgi:hypothetical protein
MKIIGRVVAAALVIGTCQVVGAPADAQFRAGGEGTGLFQGFASFMAQAAMKNQIYEDQEPNLADSQQAQCDYRACAAKYQSFSAADCTYQPHGGGTRRQCEKAATSARMVSAPPPEVAGQPGQGQCNYDACAKIYSSFRREDCTYQPYDGSPRRVCQH